MRAPNYETKFEQAVRENEATERLKSTPPRGATTYIKKRKADLKKIKKAL